MIFQLFHPSYQVIRSVFLFNQRPQRYPIFLERTLKYSRQMSALNDWSSVGSMFMVLLINILPIWLRKWAQVHCLEVPHMLPLQFHPRNCKSKSGNFFERGVDLRRNRTVGLFSANCCHQNASVRPHIHTRTQHSHVQMISWQLTIETALLAWTWKD